MRVALCVLMSVCAGFSAMAAAKKKDPCDASKITITGKVVSTSVWKGDGVIELPMKNQDKSQCDVNTIWIFKKPPPQECVVGATVTATGKSKFAFDAGIVLETSVLPICK